MGYIRGAANILEGGIGGFFGALRTIGGEGLKSRAKGLKGFVQGVGRMGAGMGQAGVAAVNTLRGPVGRGLAVTGWGGKLAGGLIGIGALGAAGAMGGYNLINARYDMANARRSDMPMGMTNMSGSPTMSFRQFGGRQWRDPNADGRLAFALSNLRKG